MRLFITSVLVVSLLSGTIVDSPVIYPISQIEITDKMPTKRDSFCLAKAIYFEARGQSLPGKTGVASVILNRLDTWGKYEDICQAVFDGCNFSWVCNPDASKAAFDLRNIREPMEWRLDLLLAKTILFKYNYGYYKDNTGGATYFHEASMERPYWADGKKIRRTVQLQDHIFYKARYGSY